MVQWLCVQQRSAILVQYAANVQSAHTGADVVNQQMPGCQEVTPASPPAFTPAIPCELTPASSMVTSVAL